MLITLLAVLQRPERFAGLVLLGGRADMPDSPSLRQYLAPCLDPYDANIERFVAD